MCGIDAAAERKHKCPSRHLINSATRLQATSHLKCTQQALSGCQRGVRRQSQRLNHRCALRWVSLGRLGTLLFGSRQSRLRLQRASLAGSQVRLVLYRPSYRHLMLRFARPRRHRYTVPMSASPSRVLPRLPLLRPQAALLLARDRCRDHPKSLRRPSHQVSLAPK